MKDKNEARRLSPAYEKPLLSPLNRPARGRGDCANGSGDAFNCLSGTYTDNCGGGSNGGAE